MWEETTCGAHDIRLQKDFSVELPGLTAHAEHHSYWSSAPQTTASSLTQPEHGACYKANKVSRIQVALSFINLYSCFN